MGGELAAASSHLQVVALAFDVTPGPRCAGSL